MNSIKIVECLHKPYLPVSPQNNNHINSNMGIYKATNRNVKTVCQIPLPMLSKRNSLRGPWHYPA